MRAAQLSTRARTALHHHQGNHQTLIETVPVTWSGGTYLAVTNESEVYLEAIRDLLLSGKPIRYAGTKTRNELRLLCGLPKLTKRRWGCPFCRKEVSRLIELV